jgi:hypothetical protein
MHIGEYRGIYFIEGSITEAVVLESFETELNGFFSQNQLKTLDDVRSKMRDYVLSRGGNSVIDFKYGQRSTFWKSLLGMDDVMWYGSGKVARINPTEIQKYQNN